MGEAWSGDDIAAVGLEGLILTSPDGLSWRRYRQQGNPYLHDVAWFESQSKFVAVGYGGIVLTSD